MVNLIELEDLIKFIDPVLANKQQGLEFSRLFELLEFKLGDTIADVAGNLQEQVQNEANDKYFYWICSGRVRLMGFDRVKQREVSCQILNQGETFGGDFLLKENSFPYRAVAASSVQIARILLEDLQDWLEKLPAASKEWQTAAQQRQSLIFFKTFTELSSLPSYRLQELLPYLKEQQVKSGEALYHATPSTAGRFWLFRGQVENQAIKIGDAWGYPDKIPPLGTAQSDLGVYYLPQQNWEAAIAIAPMLATNAQDSNTSESFKFSSRQAKPKPDLSASNGHTHNPTSPVIASESVAVSSVANSPAVEFPKPLKRRFKIWQSYPFIEQQSASDCGAACLGMISQYWGRRFSLNFLRNRAEIGRSGTSLKTLAKTAESLGYQARPVRASLSRLLEEKNPWIAHWQGDHYIVVYRIRGNKMLIADPARGKRLLSRQEFLAGWTSYALLLNPTEGLKEIKSESRSLGRFARLLLPYRSVGFQVLAASFLIQAFGLITPLFTQIILDKVVVNKSLTTLNVFAIGLLLFGVWSLLLTAVRQYLLSYLSNRLDLTMISGFISHALMLPLKFFESRHVGDIITRVSENQKIQRFLLNQVVLAWLDFMMGFIYLGLMFYYNWQLTLLIVALIPPILLLTLIATPLLREISRDVFNKSVEQNSSLVETITGIATVKATASEQELRWRWEDHLTSYLNAQFRSQKLGINLQAASGLINSLGSTALLWYGATLVIQDQLTIGQFVAFNMLIGKVLSPVLSLANLWDELQEVLISVERLNDIFNTEPEESSSKPMLVLPPVRGEVQFKNVTFRYDTGEERNTLQNISFNARAGQTIAIVGRSGSGKSTLVKLLQGLYQPDSGDILIDGHNIRHVSPNSLRSQLGVVPQECFLFSGTILENITLYRSEFSLEEAIEAAKLAEAHPFIQAMALGYNTKVGERGANLSGGQRQRIAIARALLGEPPILILDEATSSLDTESERRFQENLARLSHHHTIFIIAHRLSTVRSADGILVIESGIVVEQGNHEELMAKQDLYYHLAQQQLAL